MQEQTFSIYKLSSTNEKSADQSEIIQQAQNAHELFGESPKETT